MSKNQRSRIFQATKKPNSVFRLKSRFRDQRRDKIEFQFAVPEYRRTHSVSFRFPEPRLWRDLEISQVGETVNLEFATFSKNFANRSPMAFALSEPAPLRDEDGSQLDAAVN